MKRKRWTVLAVFAMVVALLPLSAVPATGAGGTADHLELSEVVVTPTGGEFIEIYNPTGASVVLSDYYVTDATYDPGETYYYNIVTGTNAGGGGFGDFHARFPAGASILAGEYQTIALAGSDDFFVAYGMNPTYELYEEDASSPDSVPDMREALPGSINHQGGLSNSGEVVVLYTWDGISDLVTDVDYAVWGDKVEAVDKTGVLIDGPDADSDAISYLPDTSIGDQDVVAGGSHSSGDSFQRVDITEGSETDSGGNGVLGDDETSEDLSVTWSTAEATPGSGYVAPPPPPSGGECGDPFVPIYDIQSDSSFSPYAGFAVQFLSYEGSFEAEDGEAAGQTSTDVGVSEPYDTPVGYSLQLAGTGSSYADFVWTEPGPATPGTLNSDQDFSGVPGGMPWINEIHYDNTGGDTGEFVELAGPAGFDLTGWSIVLYNGNGGYSYKTETLSGIIPDQDDGFGTLSFNIAGIQNGSPDGIALAKDDMVVASEGVVVGDFQAGLGGFNLQDPDGDGFDTTSDGIFVHYDDSDVSVGEHLRVFGAVDEFGGLTEITGDVTVTVCEAPLKSPDVTKVSLPVKKTSDWEKYEGMLVTFPQDLYITEFYNFDRFGEIVLATERQYQPTSLFEPRSDDARALRDAIPLHRITLDDGRSDQNPNPARHPNGAPFTLDNRFRGGDIVTNVTGVMDYAFGKYKIQPTVEADYREANPRPLSSPDVGGTVKVASFNVLNFFTHLDDGSLCGPKLDPDQCRGADTSDELQRQLDKIVAGIIGTGADVVGLQEIENDIFGVDIDGNRAHDPVLTLVEALNDAEGEGTWAWVGEATHYNDYPVRNEIIYKPGTVTPAGNPIAYQADAFDKEKDGYPVGRPPLAQTFIENASGGVFTVVTNHFKSKGSSCSVFGDPYDSFQANCNLTRVAQSEALLDFVDDLQAVDPDVLVIGDLNSYAKEDPIDVLRAGGFTDLHQAPFEGMDAYSYVFDGQLGYLDHALANASMLLQVKGAATWHINADEPDILDYDTTYKKDAQDDLYEKNAFRASDHDPVMVGLDLTPITVEALVGFYADTGAITGNKTLKILLDRLERARRYMEKGKAAAYKAQLQAFMNQVQGLAPKFIEQYAADVLSSEAWLLMNQ